MLKFEYNISLKHILAGRTTYTGRITIQSKEELTNEDIKTALKEGLILVRSGNYKNTLQALAGAVTQIQPDWDVTIIENRHALIIHNIQTNQSEILLTQEQI